MRAKSFVLLAICLLLTGCMCCPHQAQFDSLACSDVTSADQRSSVIAVVIGPDMDLGWSKLSDKITDAGFSKVLRGTFLTMPILFAEAEKLKCENPEIRFVVIGYDWGTIAAREFAANLVTSQCQVDQLIYLDPWTTVTRFPLPPAVEVTVVRSHGWNRGLFLEASDQMLPGVGHYDLPNHELTIEVVTTRLQQSASQVVRLKTINAASYDPTHPPYPDPMRRPDHLGSDWDFLLGPTMRPSGNQSPATPKVIPDRTAQNSP
jgi:hypothetical protein